MNFKTVLLAAAALGVAGTAQAADLAKKAPAAANYVKVCDAYGAGFFYIPGSDTCLKIGGYVRAEYRAASYNRNTYTNSGTLFRDSHSIGTYARADLQIDARTNTEMGLLRSFIEVELNAKSAGNGTTNSGTAVTTLDKAFIQFGGLTAGRATSFFDFWTGETYGSVFEPAHSDTNINLLGYTFAFGNGITASLAIEDPSSGNAGRRHGTTAYIDTSYAGVKYPDLVANVNITQAWGSAQLMAALHDDYTSVASATYDGDKWGWAIGGGVKVNLPMLGAGDQFALQAAYSKGAIDYVAPDWTPANAFDFYTIVPGGWSINQTSAWSVAAGLTHNWTKTVSTSLEASYAKFDMPDTDVRDFAQIDVQGNVVWKPVSGLSIGAEVEYRKVDYSSSNPLKDTDAVVGLIRVQRDF